MQSNLNNLIARAENLVEFGVISDFCIPENSLLSIAKELDVCLPLDFVNINKKISYIGFSAMDFSMVYLEHNCIIEDNESLREWYKKESSDQSDMSHILVLADDGGSVFMITQDSPEKPTPIIWCDYGDMYYYSIHKKFQYPHDEWPSFTAFFEYLVEREEEALKEEGEE